MIILGIETTCDETGVGIVKDGREVLSNVVASSAVMHKKFGGIVPEVAAREQARTVIPCVRQALRQAGCKLLDIDAFAVANGPGLVGSLLAGVETAKTLAFVCEKPLFAVNHLVGHVYANWVNQDHSAEIIDHRKKKSTMNYELRTPNFPLVALIVSGGHTDLILMLYHGKYKWLGGTRDDAAGEAFDKVARFLGLGYPGGPEIERMASSYKLEVTSYKFPRPMINEDNFDFSFSGLKTAVVNLVHGSQSTVYSKEEIACTFQDAVVDVLVEKTIKAAKKYNAKSIVVGGGVAANELLRSRFKVDGSRIGIPVYFPKKGLSVDNGAMIAAAAFYQTNFTDPLIIQAEPGLHFA